MLALLRSEALIYILGCCTRLSWSLQLQSQTDLFGCKILILFAHLLIYLKKLFSNFLVFLFGVSFLIVNKYCIFSNQDGLLYDVSIVFKCFLNPNVFVIKMSQHNDHFHGDLS